MSLEDQFSELAIAIKKFGFAACFESTNGISAEKWPDKTIQCLSGKNLLCNLVENEHPVCAGISYMGGINSEIIKQYDKPDFLVHIERIYPGLIEPTFNSCQGYLSEDRIALLQRMRQYLREGELTLEDFLKQNGKLNKKMCAEDEQELVAAEGEAKRKTIETRINEKQSALCNLKGMWMEEYIAAIFSYTIPEQKRLVRTRIVYDIKIDLRNFVNKEGLRRNSDIDVFVACRKKDFWVALELMEYDGYLTLARYR